MIDTGTDIPTLSYERGLYSAGISRIAGVDEVGRGALAGPLTAAAVVLPPLHQIEHDAAFWADVRDSKTVSVNRRAELAREIMYRVDSWAISAIDTEELDEIGVGAANRSAMERAVRALTVEPDMLLIDAMTIDCSVPQIGIIDGDALSLSVAAASIIAKVARDTEMVGHDPSWPVFGFARHKGYGVAMHVEALAHYGPCPIHRRSFAPVRLAEEAHRARSRR